MNPHAQGTSQRSRVVLRRRGRVRRGHDRHADPVGADGIGRHAGDERRVDAAGEPEHDALEAVLLDVVAQAERERGVDLGLVGG